MKAENRYDSLIIYYARREGMEPALVKAQLMAESGMDPLAMSPVGAMGLAQFMRATWTEWWDGTPGIQSPPPAWWDPRNPEAAIQVRCWYMAWLARQFQGDLTKALAAYNWGIGRVQRLVRMHPSDWKDFLPHETKQYIARVQRLRLQGDCPTLQPLEA